MKAEEREQAAAAVETLNRVRKIRVGFTASWTRLDDLEADAEQDLRQRLQDAWDGWAGKHGITDGEIRGPNVTARKLDYVPSADGELG